MQTSGGRAFVPHAASLSPSHTAHLDDLLQVLPARHVLLVLDLAVHAPRVPGERLDGAAFVSSGPHRACLCCLGGCSLAVWRGWRHRDTLEAVLGAESTVGVRQCGARHGAQPRQLQPKTDTHRHAARLFETPSSGPRLGTPTRGALSSAQQTPASAPPPSSPCVAALAVLCRGVCRRCGCVSAFKGTRGSGGGGGDLSPKQAPLHLGTRAIYA